MQMTEQADLGQRLLENDEQVLDEILRTFGPMIFRILSQRYCGVLRETDVEDAMSIGLFRLWKNRTRFDASRASLKVWFFRITENAAKDALKHGWQKARMMEVGGTAGLLGIADGSDNGHAERGDRIVTDTTRASPTNVQLDLREVVADLSEKQRYIVMADAAAKDGVASSQLLGDELGVPASTVRVYRKRAMDRIKTELARRGHDVPENP